MRILILCHVLPYPPANGRTIRLVNVMRELGRQHDLLVLCPDGASADLNGLGDLLGDRAEVARLDWPSHPRLGEALVPFSWRPRDVHHDPVVARMVDSHVRSWKPDFILVTDPVLGEYLHPYPDLVRGVDVAAEYALCIVRAGELGPAIARPLWHLRALKWTWYTRRLARSVDIWFVASEGDRDSLLNQLDGRARVEIVPNGVDLEANPYSVDLDAPAQVAFCSALEYEPNRDGLLWFCQEIWPLVRAQAPDCLLRITGREELVPEEVRRLPGVAPTGFLATVPPLLSACRASVVPLRFGVGTRLKILQSLAVGTPVVSTTVGAEGLPVTHGQHILLGDTPEAFAEELVRVIGSRELRQSLSEAGRRLVESMYGWDRIGVTLRAKVASLVRQGKAVASGRGGVAR